MNAVNVSFDADRVVRRLLLLAQRAHPPEVHFVDRIHVRRRARAEHHVLGDLLAHHAHRDDRHLLARLERGAGDRGGGGGTRASARGAAGAAARAGLDVAEDVLLGHPPAEAGAVDLRDVDVVVARDAADERRRLLPPRDRPCPSRCRLLSTSSSSGRVVASASTSFRPASKLAFRSVSSPASAGAAATASPAGSGCPDRRFRQRVRRRRGRGHGRLARVADGRDDAVDGDGFPFLDLDLRQDAGRRRRDLGIDLVGRDLEQRLVTVDRITDFLDPSNDGAFGDRLPHLGHYYVSHVSIPNHLSRITNHESPESLNPGARIRRIERFEDSVIRALVTSRVPVVPTSRSPERISNPPASSPRPRPSPRSAETRLRAGARTEPARPPTRRASPARRGIRTRPAR